MNKQIIAPPVPNGVQPDHTFTVQVRAVGEEAWQPVETYAAWVDMHDVRQAAVGIFDFAGAVEVRIRPSVFWIHSAVVRPLSLGIMPECDGHEVRFTLDKPADMMIEINGERFHCLHLFAGEIQPQPTENVIWLNAPGPRPRTTGCRSFCRSWPLCPRAARWPLAPASTWWRSTYSTCPRIPAFIWSPARSWWAPLSWTRWRTSASTVTA